MYLHWIKGMTLLETNQYARNQFVKLNQIDKLYFFHT